MKKRTIYIIMLFLIIMSCQKTIKNIDDLIIAIDSKKVDNSIIIKSIESGIDANSKDNNKDGFSLLHHACLQNNYELAKYLIEHGANVNIKDNDGSSPIHFANINFNIIKLLVEHGADVNAVDNIEGVTILHIVSSIEAVQYLLEHGADPNIKNSEGQTPFDAAMWNENYEKAKILHPLTKNPMSAWLKEYNKLFKK